MVQKDRQPKNTRPLNTKMKDAASTSQAVRSAAPT